MSVLLRKDGRGRHKQRRQYFWAHMIESIAYAYMARGSGCLKQYVKKFVECDPAHVTYIMVLRSLGPRSTATICLYIF